MARPKGSKNKPKAPLVEHGDIGAQLAQVELGQGATVETDRARHRVEGAHHQGF